MDIFATMVGNDVDPCVPAELASFVKNPPDHLGTGFRRLTATMWHGGRHTPAGAGGVPLLVAALRSAPRDRQGHVAVLLGLLAESDGPASEQVRTAVHDGIEVYLDLLADCRDGEPLTVALLYLLAHLPGERERVLGLAAGVGLDRADLTRLDRCLMTFDPTDPMISRVWPSPAAWAGLSDADRELDREWVRQLTSEQVRAAWDSDTRSLLAYAGARALWAVEHGSATHSPDPDLSLPPAPRSGGGSGGDLFGRYAEVFRCPACRARLVGDATGARCTGCATSYPATDGCLDLSAGVGDRTDMMARNVPLGYSALRSAFLRLMGTGWDGSVPVSAEDGYLRAQVRPVDGPVLDLGAGTGRWTAVLAESVGADRVIALDLSRAMLGQVRRALPDVLAIRGNALALPFADASLGAVNCWNTLQALPDRAAVIAEVGRCLRPGGTFTAMTFRPSPDELYGYFQSQKFGVCGVKLSIPEELRGWLADAGMTVRDQSGPGTFLFVTAVRAA